MEASAVLLSIAVLLALLIHGRVPPVVLFAVWAVTYFLIGLVDQNVFLGGYTNPALATLLILLMVSLALERSPLVTNISQTILQGSEKRVMFKLSFFSVFVSSFLNNTAVVASLLGLVSQQNKIAPSKLLIPLSYASILGGIVTLIGTSTNLVVNSLAVNAGLPEIQMFQFAWVGLPVALSCVLLLIAISSWLPDRGINSQVQQLPYFLEARVTPESLLIGKTIEENGLRGLAGLYLVEIVRDGHLLTPVGPDERIYPEDHLIFTGEIGKVQSLQNFSGLQFFGGQGNDLLSSNLVEVVLSHQSELIDKTLREVDFRTLFDAGVVGIRRGDRRLTGQLGRVPLKVGDSLLLAIGPDFRSHKNIERNFHVLTETPLRPPLKGAQNWLVTGGFLAVLTCSVFEWVPLLKGLMVLLGLLLVTKILTPGELRRRFPFDLWILIGSSLTIALALENSGASQLIADFVGSLVGNYGVWGAFIGVYIITWLLTELISNNAAAALAFPIAMATARSFNVDPTPFVMVVAYAASANFILPFGYQTHLMVYSPGRYRTADFLKVGWPITLLYSVGVIALTPYFFPFYR